MNIRFNIALTALSLSAGTTFAQEVGEYGYLSLPVSAHAAALGGQAVSIVEPEVALAEDNPALLCPEMNGQLALGYMNYVSDVNLGHVAWGGRFLELGGWMGSIRYLNYGSFDGYDEYGVSTGTFSAQDIAFTGGVGYPLSERWRVGGLVRALYSKYESYSAFALSATLGINYYNEVNGNSLSLTVSELGGQLKAFEDRRSKMPTDIQVGWSNELEHLPFCLTVTAYKLLDWDDRYVDGAGEVHKWTGGEQLLTHLNFGAEWMVNDNLWFAAAYNYRRQREFSGGGGFLRGLSYGGGFRYKGFSFQAAYARYNAVDGSLNIGLSYQFF